MSAKSLGFRQDQVSKTKIFTFSMTNKVPSYLLAIIAGNVVEKQLDYRTKVIAEPYKKK